MKKLILATAAVVLSAGAALAENPNVGIPADLYANDRTPVASSYGPTVIVSEIDLYDGSAHRFGDASPSSFQN